MAILEDLGLDDAAVAAFLLADAPRWVRGVLWCQFEGPASLDAIAAHFASRFEVARGEDVKSRRTGRRKASRSRTRPRRPRGHPTA